MDTNVIRDWAWCKKWSNEERYQNDEVIRNYLKVLFNKLLAFRESGICELGITNQIYTDYEKDTGQLPNFIEKIIIKFTPISIPTISTLPMILPTVLADSNMINEILQTVFPNSKLEHRMYGKNQKDALQLYAHWAAKRDFFITSDKSIETAKKTLLKNWGIDVKKLEEYILSKNKSF